MSKVSHQRRARKENLFLELVCAQGVQRRSALVPTPEIVRCIAPVLSRRLEGKLRIAQISPLTEAVPPKLYGGTERVISWLTEELVALGHEVTLFASGDSVTSARLEAMWPTAVRLDGSVRDPNALHMSMIEQVARRAKEFDLIHFHLDYYPFSVMSRQSTPFLTTLHGRLDLPEHEPVFAPSPMFLWCRFRTRRDGRCRTRTGLAPFITDAPFSWSPARRTRPISLFWGAFRQRSGPIAPFISPNAAACRSRSRQKSTQRS